MRTYEYINSGWRFSKVGGLPEGRQTEPKSDDNGWELVELPHTWNAADCTGGSGRMLPQEGKAAARAVSRKACVYRICRSEYHNGAFCQRKEGRSACRRVFRIQV